MRPIARTGLVIAGYVFAFLVACAAVALYISATSGPDRQDYAGMASFGDSLLFLGVFAVASVPATATALFFLRPSRGFWRVLSVAAVLIAASAVAALTSYFVANAGVSNSLLGKWADFAVLRLLVSPLVALGFFVSALAAPAPSYRITLLAATAVETAAFAYLALTWFLQLTAK